MSKFEDHLWREFVREQGDALTQTSGPAATHTRRARPRLVVGTGLGLAGAAGVVALVLGATTTSPAFAVTRNHDGTVTISIHGSGGIPGANAKLHRLGIRANVVSQVPVGCQVSIPMGGQGASERSYQHRIQVTAAAANWTIDPRRIPQDRTLALTPPPTPPGQNSGTSDNSGNSGSSGNVSNNGSRGQVWSCGTEAPGAGSPPPPPLGNSGNSGPSGNS